MARKSEGRKDKHGDHELSSKPRQAAQPDRRDGHKGNGKSYRQKIKEKKLAEGNKKNGCFPKLFMLLLPFIGVGAYFLFGS